jgi:WD40 repeat protein
MLTAATTIVDNNERLRWLLIALAVAGAAAAAPAAVLLSPWWTHRQAQRAAAAEAAREAMLVRQERARRREVDLRTHFEPLGRGVAQPDWRGQYFTGRTRVLKELVGWLSAPPGTMSRIRVVTGRPGSGKSAVLGRLVTLSDPVHRAKVPLGDASAGTVPPEGCIDVSVHAHGKTIEQILAVLAEATGIHADSPEELLLALANRVARLAVVVDALDEAVKPDEVARLLLRPLARSEGGAGVRLLVGTRPHLVGLLGAAPTDILDLDDPGYFDRGDLAEYARRCLLAESLATDDPQLPSPYQSHPELARRVAEAIGARAGTAFLVAQLASRALARDDRVVDLAEPGWQQRLPATVGAAMDDYLARLGAKEQPSREQQLRDLLLPLAYAQGLGLPDEDLWAVLASATGTRRYEGHDVRWLLATGAVDLVQQGGTKQAPAYRLFHEALAEHLRAQRQESHDQRRYVRALLGRVPVRPGEGGRDWSVADPYTRMHLPAHAARAGLLDELLIDPGFLLAADPARLLSVLPAARALLARTAELVFQQAAPYLLAAPADDRAAYLEMAARRNHADGLAERFAELQPQRPWLVAWTDWQPASPHRILGNHAGMVLGVAVAEHEGRRIVVSNGGDGYVRRWDLATGAPVGDPIVSGDPCGPVRLGQLDGRAVVVGCAKRRDEAVVEVWDLVRGTLAREPIPLGGMPSWAIVYGEVTGRSLAVIGGEDGQLWVCDLDSGAVVWTAQTRAHAPVWRVLIAELHQRPVVLSSSVSRDGAEIWDLATGELVAPPIEHRPLAVVPGNRRLLAVELGTIESWSERMLGFWDLDSARLLGEIPAGFAWYWRELRVLTTAGATLAVAGCTDGFVRVWDLNRARRVGTPLLGHDGVVTALTATTLDGQPIAISGGGDGTIRVWELELDAPAPEAVDRDSGVVALDIRRSGDAQVIVAGGPDGQVQIRRLTDGKLARRFTIAKRLAGYTRLDGALIAVQMDQPPPADDTEPPERCGEARLWDLLDHCTIGRPLRIRSAQSGRVVGVIRVDADAEPLIFMADSTGHEAKIRICNVDTQGLQPGPHRIGDVWNWYAQAADRSQVVVADRTGAARILDLSTGDVRELLPAGSKAGRIFTAQLDDRPVVIAGGSADAPIRVWDLATLQPAIAPLPRQGWGVYAVALGTLQDRRTLLAGDSGGGLWIWDLERRQVRTIQTGAMILDVALAGPNTIVCGGPLGITVLHVTDALWALAEQPEG